MKQTKQKIVLCQVCGKQTNRNEAIRAASIRASVSDVIRRSVPSWSPDGYICQEDLHKFREQYVHSLLESETGELTRLESEVLQSLKEHELLSENLNESFRDGDTLYSQSNSDLCNNPAFPQQLATLESRGVVVIHSCAK